MRQTLVSVKYIYFHIGMYIKVVWVTKMFNNSKMQWSFLLSYNLIILTPFEVLICKYHNPTICTQLKLKSMLMRAIVILKFCLN